MENRVLCISAVCYCRLLLPSAPAVCYCRLPLPSATAVCYCRLLLPSATAVCLLRTGLSWLGAEAAVIETSRAFASSQGIRTFVAAR